MGPLVVMVVRGGGGGDDGAEEYGRFSAPPLLTPLFALIVCILPLPPPLLPFPVFEIQSFSSPLFPAPASLARRESWVRGWGLLGPE